jgi:Ca2+-binding RTX toxin-like protein
MRTRRITMLVALMVVMVAMFATAAYAAHITITGNNKPNTLDETNQNDAIRGLGGADVLDASLYGNEVDRLWGGNADDELRADDHDGFDTLVGGKGYDVCTGDATDSFDISCNEVHAK